jgi:hypothetical protein
MGFRWLTLFIIFNFYLTINSQDIYYVTQDNEFFRFDLQDYSSTSLYTVNPTGIGNIVDIAFDTQGNLFAITNFDLILEIDLVNQSYEIEYSITTPGTFPGLVSNAQDELFFGGWFNTKLFKLNLSNQTIEELTQGIPTPGDFTFYKGNLLFPNGNENTIGSFSGSDISDVGCSEGVLFSLVNVFTDCENNAIYGIDDQNNLYSYDIGTNTHNLILQIDAPNTIFGATTLSEAFASDCTLESLEEIDCNLSVDSFNEQEITIFPNPFVTELNFQLNDFQIEKIILRDALGRKISEYNSKTTKISSVDLDVGFYFVEFYFQNSRNPVIKKILKK